MSKIEQTKAYTGTEMEKLFFRPILSGPAAESLGIRVMYNMPVPTTLNFWRRDGDILQKFGENGWSGTKSDKVRKNIDMTRVKAEMGYSAADYFSLVSEQIQQLPEVNMQDLSGTELEYAETELFKQAIADSIRNTMWIGNTERDGKFTTFDGILTKIHKEVAAGNDEIMAESFPLSIFGEESPSESIFETLWSNASSELRELKSEGHLVLFVTSDLYERYEGSLDNASLEAAYLARQNGRSELLWRGIPVVDIKVQKHLIDLEDLPSSMALLTDRRNLALAVNTADFPGTEVNMWYNPDMMENRQRAVFAAGCDYLLPELLSFAYLQM
ncbi:MAG: hypothetical protein J6R31_00975 [Rikenellaceae bacterium]|nr:hypothetical protein [Rikenellaceae bacterium]